MWQKLPNYRLACIGDILGAGIASGVSNLAGGAIAAIANHHEAKLSREWEEKMVDKQNQWNLDQWNRENEYNSPLEQQKRLQAAGINPIDASNLTDAGSASSVQSASNNPVSPPHIDNPLRGLSEVSQSAALQKQTDADVELKEAQGEYYRAAAGNQTEQAKTEDALRQGQLDLQGARIQLAVSGSKLNEASVKELAQRVNESKARVEEIYQKITNLKQDFDFKPIIINIEKAKASAMEKQAYAAISQATVAAKAEERAQELQKYKVIEAQNNNQLQVKELTFAEIRNNLANIELKFKDADEYLRLLNNYGDWLQKTASKGPFGIDFTDIFGGGVTHKNRARRMAGEHIFNENFFTKKLSFKPSYVNP